MSRIQRSLANSIQYSGHDSSASKFPGYKWANPPLFPLNLINNPVTVARRVKPLNYSLRGCGAQCCACLASDTACRKSGLKQHMRARRIAEEDCILHRTTRETCGVPTWLVANRLRVRRRISRAKIMKGGAETWYRIIG